MCRNNNIEVYSKAHHRSFSLKPLSNNIDTTFHHDHRQSPNNKKLRVTMLSLIVWCIFSCSDHDFGQALHQPITEVKQTSLTLTGFGESINVTNKSQISLIGQTSSDEDLTAISIKNNLTGAKGVIPGNKSWQADISLQQGDNLIVINAMRDDQVLATLETNIIYHPEMAFTTPLQLSHQVVYLNEDGDVNAMIGFTPEQKSAINDNFYSLQLVHDTNNFNSPNTSTQASITVLYDNGQLPDEIESDGLFSGKLNIDTSKQGKHCYKVNVINHQTSLIYTSETRCVWVRSRLNNEHIDAHIQVANALASIAEKQKKPQDIDAFRSDGLDFLSKQHHIAQSGAGLEGSLWWISHEGLLGAFHPILTDKRSGLAPLSPATNTVNTQGYTHLPPTLLVPFTPRYYSQAVTSTNLQPTNTSIDATYIKSNQAVIFSPYINHPLHAEANLASTDDYFSIWSQLSAANSCKLFPAAEFINSGSIDIGLDDFKQLSEYGYIHISTHGDSYYNGLYSQWKDIWGPKDFLRGSQSLTALYTGIRLNQRADGSYDITGYEDDLQNKRLALSVGGTVVILPQFFHDYIRALPNSLVSLSACRTLYNNSMAQVLLNRGAGAVLGYDGYVISRYAQEIGASILQGMLSQNLTLQQAIDQAKNLYGSSDKSYSTEAEPSHLRFAGNPDLRLSQGQLQNTSFEVGQLSAWKTQGDGRLLMQLGDTKASHDDFFGIVSTGLGYTLNTGSLSQTFCVAENSRTLTFSWNFFSEEFIEFCDTQFDDAFTLNACELDTDDCHTLFTQDINSLCQNPTQLIPETITFDQDNVYSTGWQHTQIDISHFAGQAINIEFNSSDRGDSLFDSAILIDNILIQ